MGGVAKGEDAAQLMLAGASAVAVGTEQGNSAGRPISTYRLELQKLLAPET